MTITQTVTIPASRRLIIDMPPDFPEGLATLTFAPAEVKPAIPHNSTTDGDAPFLRWFGRHKNIPGATVDNFLAGCREDKELELAIEKHQMEERNHHAELSP